MWTLNVHRFLKCDHKNMFNFSVLSAYDLKIYQWERKFLPDKGWVKFVEKFEEKFSLIKGEDARRKYSEVKHNMFILKL